MTEAQLQAIYKANLAAGNLTESHEACMAIGYLLGKSVTVTSATNLQGIVASLTNPASIPVMKGPDLR